jgi:hypothetical protein
MTNRRGFLAALAAILAAPVVAVKSTVLPKPKPKGRIYWTAFELPGGPITEDEYRERYLIPALTLIDQMVPAHAVQIKMQMPPDYAVDFASMETTPNGLPVRHMRHYEIAFDRRVGRVDYLALA